jgi:hypothetical protein
VAFNVLHLHSAFEVLGGEWCGVFPGQPGDADFLGCWLVAGEVGRSSETDDTYFGEITFRGRTPGI